MAYFMSNDTTKKNDNNEGTFWIQKQLLLQES